MEDLKTQIKKMIFALESFTKTAELGWPQVPQEFPNYIFSKIFLEAMSFELIIKAFYLIEKKESHPHHHNIKEIFDELSDETQKMIQGKFAEKVSAKNKAQAEKMWTELYIPNFDELLEHNQKLVTHFKYDAQLANWSILNQEFLNDLKNELTKKFNQNCAE